LPVPVKVRFPEFVSEVNDPAAPPPVVNIVPLVAGRVNTVDPAAAGASSVTVPEISPAITRLDKIILLYSKAFAL
jgi:hypothetical protein